MTENPEPKKKEKITRCPIEIEVTDDITKKRYVFIRLNIVDSVKTEAKIITFY